MKIEWTRCSDAMPTKSSSIIAKSSSDKPFLTDGFELIAHKGDLCKQYGTDDMFNAYEYKWTPYTPEKWKKLNK